MSKKKKNQVQKQKPIIDFDQEKAKFPSKKRKNNVELVPRNLAQEKYILALENKENRINFAIGPAGTGKTMLGVLAAVKALKNKEVSKLVLTRPAVSVDEQHGFLPGDLNQKMEPWVLPIFDILEEYWSPAEIKKMQEEKVIEICPLAFMRGRTFKNSYIIADEIQNSTPNQGKMLMTRIGEGSTMCITGDIEQHDRGFDDNALKDFLERIDSHIPSGISMTKFEKRDVERDPIVQTILTIYED